MAEINDHLSNDKIDVLTDCEFYIYLPPLGQFSVPKNKIIFTKALVKKSQAEGVLIRNQEHKYLYYSDIDVYLAICSNGSCENRCRSNGSRICYKHSGKAIKCERCDKAPSFNFPGETKRRFCNEHKEPGMIDIAHKRCEKCTKRPCFNFKGQKSKFCSDHKEQGMIYVEKHNYCECCDKIPVFNFQGEKHGKFCSDHKLSSMINVVDRKCEFCNKQPCFNFIGEKAGKFCADHKYPDMINVKDKTCELCNKRPSFNFLGENSSRFCVDHKQEGMVNIVSKTCELCCKQPVYNNFGEKKGRFCLEHKLNGMVDVKNRKCEMCDNRALYGIVSEYPKRCRDHKQLGMLDLSNKRCIIADCPIYPSFGPLFGTKRHCFKHKSNNEFSIPNAKCLVENCDKRPYFTNDGTSYPLRCDSHRESNDVNIVERPCSNCGLSWFIPLDRDKCNDCYEFLQRKVRNIKETRVYQLLITNGILLESYDKIISGGCSLKRPDIVIDKGTFKLILEIDENGHTYYDCSCEQTRMGQIYFDFGGVPLIFIRYNPDSYTDFNGIKHSSDRRRETYLLDFIRSFDNLEMVSDPLTIYYLFYNGWTGSAIDDKYTVDPYIMRFTSPAVTTTTSS